MKVSKFVKILFLFVVLYSLEPAFSQTIPQDFSTIRVDELSDEQVRTIIRQMEASGMDDSQLDLVVVSKGMRPEEVTKFRDRIERLKRQDQSNGNQPSSPLPSQQTTRQVMRDSTTNRVDPQTELAKAIEALKPKIFGADLFRSSTPTFVPNMRLATPQNYQVGPDDQIVINVSGLSVANWNLPVSPEGNINLPNIGLINLSGRSIEQATSLIRSRLAANNYAVGRGTNVSVSLGNIRSIHVILTGALVSPGTKTLPAVATVYNALEASGGPSINGSFREIEVIRNGKVLSKVDIYDFLVKGLKTNDVTLRDQDIIRVPVYRTRIEMAGEVKIPALFEALPGESLRDMLNYAGGFTTKAYSARVSAYQNTARERRQTDISEINYGIYTPRNGDKYIVQTISDRFENRVILKGAVFRPDQYELIPGLTLKQLISKADGVREDAFLSRGFIIRLKSDNSTESIPFDIGRIVEGTSSDITLQREDVITIPSRFDLRDEYKVIVNGEVRKPGEFNYAEGMTLEELIIAAGGFKEGASNRHIEVARRVKNSEVNSASASIAGIFQVDVETDLKLQNGKFVLQPFDIVSVRAASGYERQRQVAIVGEVVSPGNYTIQRKDERISDLIKRAGGLTALAYTEGASLKRPGPSTKGASKNEINKKSDDEERLSRLQHLQSNVKDSISISDKNEVLRNVNVGIELNEILLNPGSGIDLVLEEGDTLRVPKQLQTVKVSGEVSSPITIIYGKSKGFKQYISEAGGFSDRSLKRRAYVLYANGSVKGTGKLLFFNSYPTVKPGAEIFVPKKEDKKKLSAAEVVGISTGLASLAAIILSVLK